MAGEIRPGILEFLAGTTLEISGGEITVTQGFHIIAAETGTADELDTINLGSNLDVTRRQWIFLMADVGDTITLKHNNGNMLMNGFGDFSLTDAKVLALVHDGTNWHDITNPSSPTGETAWGFIKVYQGVTTQAGITTSFTKMTAFNTAQGSNGVSLNTTNDKANNQITVTNAGVYEVAISISTSGSANVTFVWEIYINDLSVGVGAERKISSGGDVGDFTWHAPLQLAAGDVVSIYVKSDAGGGASLTPSYAQLDVNREGD